MARTKSDNVQINIFILTGWKTELENPARIYLLRKERVSYFLTCCVEEFMKKIN